MQIKRNLQCKNSFKKKDIFGPLLGPNKNQPYILSTRMMQTEHQEHLGPARQLRSR